MPCFGEKKIFKKRVVNYSVLEKKNVKTERLKTSVLKKKKKIEPKKKA